MFGKLINILVILGFSGAATIHKVDINFVVMVITTREKFNYDFVKNIYNSNVKLTAGTLKFLFPGDSIECKCNEKKFSQFCFLKKKTEL